MIKIITEMPLFSLTLTFIFYGLGCLLKQKYKTQLINPILFATVSIIVTLSVTNIDYQDYCAGSKSLSLLLTPATICLALPLYEKISLFKHNWRAMSCGILAGAISSALSIYFMAKFFGISHAEYVTLLPKSVTTAIGMEISAQVGGNVAVTVAAIILTGIIGNFFAAIICNLFGIKHPIAIGIAIGSASHAIGTARAIELGQTEGAVSGLAMTVSGLLTVLIVPLFTGLI